MGLRHFLAVLLLGALLVVGCRGDQEQLVVYSGRSQVLVDQLVEEYRRETDRRIQVRFGRDSELLAALEEEGHRSPADLFWANTAGALSAAVNAGLLVSLPDSILAQPAAFVPSGGLWVPISVRFRVLAYHPDRVDPQDLPGSVMNLPGMEDLRGRIGWTPTYSSFQDFVTALRSIHGEDATREWLDGMRGLSPSAYPSNAPMLEALAAGEIDVALTNHYYILRVQDDAGRRRGVAMHRFVQGDVGNLALVTGAGLLATSDDHTEALDFINHLLTTESQSQLAERVFEYPVVRGASLPPGSPSFEDVLRLSPDLDYDQLLDMAGTQRLLREVGLL